MKTTIYVLGFLLALAGDAAVRAATLGTAIPYQGRLNDGGNPARGSYDFRFTLHDLPTGGKQQGAVFVSEDVPVTAGLFFTEIDFGAGVFVGDARWLEMAIRPAVSTGDFTTLSPRQNLNASPYALFAPNAGSARTAASVGANAVADPGIQNAGISAVKIAPGQVVKSINGLFDNVSLTAGANVTLTPSGNTLQISANTGSGGGAGWSLTGNSGTTAGTQFLGTLDGQPLELRAGNARGLRLEYVVRGSIAVGQTFAMNLLGGHYANVIAREVIGATVAGGGYTTTITVPRDPIPGGGLGGNRAARDSTGKGVALQAAGSGNFTTPGNFGDIGSVLPEPPPFANQVISDFGTVGGGAGNIAGQNATVPGGVLNRATGVGSFAAGRNAQATHDASFVWGDGSQAAKSTGVKRFEVLATGGVNFYPGGASVTVNGPQVMISGLGNEQAYLGGDGIGDDVQIGSLNPNVNTIVAYNGASGQIMHLAVRSLTITGGADLAEPFVMTEGNLPKGSVVVIDSQHPGKLKRSDQAYDKRVAGVISGANGVNTGINLKQEGFLEGGENVALTGRVYVHADATHGAIKPGDLLTTSDTPGHAMKVSDHARAQGAILGKAMSALQEGKGLVLVLVTLQ